jgi:hypothetical protein
MGIIIYLENCIYKWKSGTVRHRYWKAEPHIKGLVSIGTVRVMMVSRVLRVQHNIGHSMMLGVGQVVSRYRAWWRPVGPRLKRQEGATVMIISVEPNWARTEANIR